MKLLIIAIAGLASTAAADGLHDFDSGLGTWKEHTTRLDKPLTGSKTWFPVEGYSSSWSVLGGRVNVVEYNGDGPKGHLSLISIRIYDPDTKQWRMNFSTPSRGSLWPTPMVGTFHDGRGEFYSQDDIDGRAILVRFSIIPETATTQRTEQAFSNDGGKTWETNWINDYTRVDSIPTRAATEHHDFDFDSGVEKIHIKKLSHGTWADYTGTHTIHKLWGGLADVVELSADGPAGHLEGVGLRMFDPATHEWNLNWLSTGTAYFGVPAYGRFANGRGEFYDTEQVGDRTVLVRGVWSDITATSSKFEQAFSSDGGRTWETNWITSASR
ncbi:MAG TPA: hypothetical protein VGG28_13670 [Kofleriaceae bacterium]|jgi:hypothetical protein